MVEVTHNAGLAVPVSDRDHSQGPADAPYTLLEYGDFQCPYCRQAARAVHEVQAALGEQLRYIFRHFPLTVHPNAQAAAEAAEAAAAQGSFWEMHDLLFAHQRELDTRSLVSYARELGLDADLVREELESHAYADRVAQDEAGGEQSGVQGTPSFFINGSAYQGPWDAESLLQALRAM